MVEEDDLPCAGDVTIGAAPGVVAIGRIFGMATGTRREAGVVKGDYRPGIGVDVAVGALAGIMLFGSIGFMATPAGQGFGMRVLGNLPIGDIAMAY